MAKGMVKEHTLFLMEESMKEDGRMGKNMVKVHGLHQREKIIWVSPSLL